MDRSNNMELKNIIKNAKSACKRDGYNQIVTIDKDGSYGFRRNYHNCVADWENVKIIHKIIGKWMNGIYQITVQ